MSDGLSPFPGGKSSAGTEGPNESPETRQCAELEDGCTHREAPFRSSFDEAEKKRFPQQNEEGSPEECPECAGPTEENVSQAPDVPGAGFDSPPVPSSPFGGGRIYIEEAGIAGVAVVLPEAGSTGTGNRPSALETSALKTIGTAFALYPYQAMNTDQEETISRGNKVHSDAMAGETRSATGGAFSVPVSVAPQAVDVSPNVEAPRAPIHVSSVAKAMEIVQHLGDRLKIDGRDRATLRLVLDDGTSLTVRFTRTDDTIRTAFRVDSASLQQALQMHWSQLSHHADDKGLRFAPPVFETATGGSRDDSHDAEGRFHPGDEVSGDRAMPLDRQGRESRSQPMRKESPRGWHAWA